MADKLFLVMPAYNEEKNIVFGIIHWMNVLLQVTEDFKIVVINDGSTDGTEELLRDLEATYPFLIVISRENKGHGPTIIEGYKYAIEHGADYVFQTDSDGQTDPDDFEKFWDRRHDYSAIFGRRLHREDGNDRIFVEFVLCKLLWGFFRVNIPDANAPFRLFEAGKLKEYLSMIPDNYTLPNVMLTVFFSKKEKIIFKNIHFYERCSGKNSMDFIKIIKIGIKSARDFSYFRKKYKG